MPAIMKIIDGPVSPLPCYLVAADLEASATEPPSYPTGEFTTTIYPHEARRFPDVATALTEWRQASVRVPLRPDGMPNRPMTALTVEIVEVPE